MKLYILNHKISIQAVYFKLAKFGAIIADKLYSYFNNEI